MNEITIPEKNKLIISRSEDFLMECLKHLPFVDYGRLDLYSVPFETIEVDNDYSTDGYEKRPAETEEIRDPDYLSKCKEKRVIPFSEVKMVFDRRKQEFHPYEEMRIPKISIDSVLFNQGGKPYHIELGLWNHHGAEMRNLYNRLQQFLSKNEYHLIIGRIGWGDRDSMGTRIEARMRTSIEGKKLVFWTGQQTPKTKEDIVQIENWFEKAYELSKA